MLSNSFAGSQAKRGHVGIIDSKGLLALDKLPCAAPGYRLGNHVGQAWRRNWYAGPRWAMPGPGILIGAHRVDSPRMVLDRSNRVSNPAPPKACRHSDDGKFD